MLRSGTISCVGLLAFIAGSMPAHAQFTYAPINVPGAVATEARGINNNGEVVGFYQTTTCTNTDVRVPTCPTKGFKFVNGKYVKLMVPGSNSTAIMGVNDLGDLTGFYKKADGSEHGFIWFHNNVVRTIDFRANGTVPWGINKAGMVVGGIWGTGSNGTFPSGGWVWINGKFSNMNPDNGAGPCCESVTGISNNGILSGLVFQSDFFMAWMKQSTDEDFFTFPHGGAQCCDTSGTGINNNINEIGFTGGQGWFTKKLEGAGDETESSGEVTPQFVKVNFPGQVNGQPLPTYPFGINDQRWIAGVYTDSSNHVHGFVAKPNF
ncbi:MAG TPA: hypothetical protein VFA85_09180 [Terriglobales bacterium]|nr:hypothetical protein [Terriglobales bacterium]